MELPTSDLLRRWIYSDEGIRKLIKRDQAFPQPSGYLNRRQSRVWREADIKRMRQHGFQVNFAALREAMRRQEPQGDAAHIAAGSQELAEPERLSPEDQVYADKRKPTRSALATRTTKHKAEVQVMEAAADASTSRASRHKTKAAKAVTPPAKPTVRKQYATRSTKRH